MRDECSCTERISLHLLSYLWRSRIHLGATRRKQSFMSMWWQRMGKAMNKAFTIAILCNGFYQNKHIKCPYCGASTVMSSNYRNDGDPKIAQLSLDTAGLALIWRCVSCDAKITVPRLSHFCTCPICDGRIFKIPCAMCKGKGWMRL